jgi:hypothetical protein
MQLIILIGNDFNSKFSDLQIRTNSPSTDQSRAEGNNTECVGKKRFNGRVLPTGFGKSYVPPFWTRYYNSLITILPSESGVTLHHSTILP